MHSKLKSSSYEVPCILFNVVQCSGIAVHFEYRKLPQCDFWLFIFPRLFRFIDCQYREIGDAFKFDFHADHGDTSPEYAPLTVCVLSSDIYLNG